MLEVKPLELSHLQTLNLTEHYEKITSPGYAWALVKDGVAIAAGGVTIPHDRCAIVWTNIEPCRESKYLMRRIHFIARHLLDQLKSDLDRIQADVLADDRRACQWPRRFGFHYEGKMKKYWQGKTYLRFAWVRAD